MSAPKKTSAGKRDLTAAVAQLHRTQRNPLVKGEHNDPAWIQDQFLLAAGDAPDRVSFFDYEEGEPTQKNGRTVHVSLGRDVELPDYRTRDYQRTNRSMITIPPGVKANVRRAFGAETDAEFPSTVAVIALADWAAKYLQDNQLGITIRGAEDRFKALRKMARRDLRRAKAEKQ